MGIELEFRNIPLLIKKWNEPYEPDRIDIKEDFEILVLEVLKKNKIVFPNFTKFQINRPVLKDGKYYCIINTFEIITHKPPKLINGTLIEREYTHKIKDTIEVLLIDCA